ncbi:MAG: T9SS type A sorting domain-containing protein [Bacteroidota bacterium]
MKFLYTLIFSAVLVPLLTAQTTLTFDSFVDGNSPFFSFPDTSGVVGQEDYIMDISGTGNPTGTTAVLGEFQFVGGTNFPNSEVAFDFFDADGFFVSGFTLTLTNSGIFVYNIPIGGGFIINTSGFVQMTVDPNGTTGAEGQWFIRDEVSNPIAVGSSPDDPFDLGNTPNGGPGVFAFKLIIEGDPISDDTCPLTDEIDDNPIASGTYNAENTITSSGTVPSPNVVIFEAGQSITLEQGFVAENGSTFTARIQTCTPTRPSGESIRREITVTENGAAVTAIPMGIGNRPNPLAVESRSNALSIENEVSIYPNPFSEQTMVEVHLATESDLQVELYDLAGSKVSTIAAQRNVMAGTHQFTVDATQLEGGMYLLMIRTNDGIQTKKLSLIK